MGEGVSVASMGCGRYRRGAVALFPLDDFCSKMWP